MILEKRSGRFCSGDSNPLGLFKESPSNGDRKNIQLRSMPFNLPVLTSQESESSPTSRFPGD